MFRRVRWFGIMLCVGFLGATGAARTEGLMSRDTPSRGGDGTVEGRWLGWLRGFGESQGGTVDGGVGAGPGTVEG